MGEKSFHRLPPIHTWTGDQAYNLGMCADRESHLQPFVWGQRFNQLVKAHWSRPHWFLQPEVMGTFLPGTGTLGSRVWCGAGAPRSLGGDLCSWDILPNFCPPYLWVWDKPIPCLCPSYLSQCGFFFNSLVVGLPFSQISGSSEWWLFCSVDVILMWLGEEVSTMFT